MHGYAGSASDRKDGGGSAAAQASMLEKVLRAGGVFGGHQIADTGTELMSWSAAGTTIAEAQERRSLPSDADLPAGWLDLDKEKKETAGAALTVDLNELRSKAEGLFDAPWLQRTLDRLALDNARLVSIRAAIVPPSADNLPPMLEVKAVASARSVAPGPAKPITLVAGGWSGTAVDAAAVSGARWAATLRFDSSGLGVIGRDGGVGTFAGLVRLCVDAVGTGQVADTAAWSKDYKAWLERSNDALRSLSTRVQQRGTLACYGSVASPDLVLVIPARSGEKAGTLAKTMDQLAAAGGMTSKNGVWTLKDGGILTPRLAITVCDTPSGCWLVMTVEHSADRALLQDVSARVLQTK
jgi:hypothetical protein